MSGQHEYETVANWGEVHQAGPEPARPDLPAGPPPAGGGRRVPRRAVVALIVGGALALLGGVIAVGGAIISAQAADPGIEFCEAIRDDEADDVDAGTASQESWTFEEYQEAREALSSSRHEEIRVPALALVDVIWQVEQLDEDAGFEALPLVGALTDSYAALSGGCAQHGVQLPPLEALS